MKRYRRSTAVEPLRKFCRASDFLLLLRTLSARGRLPAFSQLKTMTLVEMGPGPMRLAAFKRRLFREVCFLDISDFDIPDPGLFLLDLETCGSVEAILGALPPSARTNPILLCADHCLEHISTGTLTSLFASIASQGLGACFRVPNILSPAGHRSYLRDNTHRTSFDPRFRRDRENSGFVIAPWIRWYRPRLLYQRWLGARPAMSLAEEIVLTRRPVSL